MAVSIRVRGTVPRFSADDNLRALTDYAVDNVRGAAGAFLEAATQRVPIWSGMAQASLLRLSELAGRRLAIAPLRTRSRVAQGRALGQATLTAREGRATIAISVQVPHYVEQESKNVGVSKSAPWQSFPAGQEAASEFLNNAPPFQLQFSGVRRIG